MELGPPDSGLGLKQKKKYKIQWCESVRILGNKLTIHFNDDLRKPNINEEALLSVLSLHGVKKLKKIFPV